MKQRKKGGFRLSQGLNTQFARKSQYFNTKVSSAYKDQEFVFTPNLQPTRTQALLGILAILSSVQPSTSLSNHEQDNARTTPADPGNNNILARTSSVTKTEAPHETLQNNVPVLLPIQSKATLSHAKPVPLRAPPRPTSDIGASSSFPGQRLGRLKKNIKPDKLTDADLDCMIRWGPVSNATRVAQEQDFACVGGKRMDSESLPGSNFFFTRENAKNSNPIPLSEEPYYDLERGLPDNLGRTYNFLTNRRGQLVADANGHFSFSFSIDDPTEVASNRDLLNNVLKEFEEEIMPALEHLTGGGIYLLKEKPTGATNLPVTEVKLLTYHEPDVIASQSSVLSYKGEMRIKINPIGYTVFHHLPTMIHEFAHGIGYDHPQDLVNTTFQVIDPNPQLRSESLARFSLYQKPWIPAQNVNSVMSYTGVHYLVSTNFAVLKYILDPKNKIAQKIPPFQRKMLSNFVSHYAKELSLGFSPIDIVNIQSDFGVPNVAQHAAGILRKIDPKYYVLKYDVPPLEHYQESGVEVGVYECFDGTKLTPGMLEPYCDKLTSNTQYTSCGAGIIDDRNKRRELVNMAMQRHDKMKSEYGSTWDEKLEKIRKDKVTMGFSHIPEEL